MEYAVVEVAGKQYRVNVGDVIEVDRIAEEKGSVSFDRVLLYVNDSEMNLGKPYITGMNVTAKVINSFRGKKIRVARFTAKSRHRRVVGFRPSLTRLQIEKISGKVASTASPKVEKAKKA